MDFNQWLGNLSRVEDEHIERDNYIGFGEPLDIDKIGFYGADNAGNHRTEKFELVKKKKIPILRRAAYFYVSFTFRGRALDVRKDKILLVFSFGAKPNPSLGTQVILPVNFLKPELFRNKVKWDVVQHKTAPKILVLKVQIGSEAPIGAWKLHVETSFANDKFSPRRIEPAPSVLYILFNPYNQDDQVFMPSEAKLEEYIQNPTGKIWKGDHKQVNGRQWVFGQFDEIVLPAICYILDTKANINDGDRGNPVKVARAISSIVNSADNNGILRGKWSEPYDDGTSPWDWNGSPSIFQEFVEKNREVKYGQCWVFSALTVTVCRALGIPCRSVTNYVSGHDTNRSLTIDKFFNENGEELTPENHPDIGFDSIWNFHVWNDVWMSRPDLSHGYGGWQAIDSTPQEASHGLYQCGPAPLLAIKRGEIALGFDTRFIFSEVNADICHFIKDPTSEWGFVRSKLKTEEVGKLLITQLPGYTNHEGEDDYENITLQYKNMEGTTEERLSVFNAIRGVEKAQLYYEIPKNAKMDILIRLSELESVNFGSSYIARIYLENASNHMRTLNCLVSSSSVYYTGIKAHEISRARGEFVLKPGQRETLALTVSPEAYLGKLVEYCMVKVYGLIRVKETHQTWSDEDDFVLNKPKLLIQPVGWFRYGQLGRIRMSFRNPLHVPLTNCKLRLGAAGLFDEVKEDLRNIGPYESFNHESVVKMKSSGSSSVVVTFSSKEMIDVSGSAKLEVQ